MGGVFRGLQSLSNRSQILLGKDDKAEALALKSCAVPQSQMEIKEVS